MKRQRSYGDNLDSGGEKSGGKEWERRDPDGCKFRSVKNLESQSSDRSIYRHSCLAKLDAGRSEDHNGRTERKRFLPEGYSHKEHSDYRTERKGLNRVESMPKRFRDSVGERSHRSSSNGFSSSSLSFRREYYDGAPKAKDSSSKRYDSAWRRSNSKERKVEDGAVHVLPRVSSFSGEEIGVGRENRCSVNSARAVESMKVENADNSSSEMEEGELEPEKEPEAVGNESLTEKVCNIKAGKADEQIERAPKTISEEGLQEKEKERSESCPAVDKSELHDKTETVEDCGSSAAEYAKQGQEKFANGEENESDESGKSLGSEARGELLKDRAFPCLRNMVPPETSFDEAIKILKSNQSSENLWQDLNEKANAKDIMLDAKLMVDDEENEADNRQSVIAIPKNLGAGVLADDANKLAVEEVGGTSGRTENSKIRGNTMKEVNRLNHLIPSFTGDFEKNLLVSGDHSETRLEEKSGSINAKECRRIIGFELFSETNFKDEPKTLDTSVEKNKIKNREVETLQPSLGLPVVSLTLASPNLEPDMSPSSSRSKSTGSLPTNSLETPANSERCTPSISISASQQFIHNPICSLTKNTLDNCEHSVGSNPIFQTVEQIPQGSWQVKSPSGEMHDRRNSGGTERFRQRKQVPLYQRVLQSGNGAFQPVNNRQRSAFGLVNGNGHFQEKSCALPRNHVQSEGSHRKASELERQFTFTGDRADYRGHQVVRSPEQSVGSQETGSGQTKNDHSKRWLDRDLPILRNNMLMGTAQLQPNAIQTAEKLISDIVSEPVAVMAARLQEMPNQFLIYLKENVQEILVSGNLKNRLSELQGTLRRRTDLTMEILSNSHPVQLEILVAVKTGLHAFLRPINNIPPSDLVEIFLNLKCRNLSCRNILPVDDCDCKMCGQKNGFCNACMCLVCLKFDLASNTCSWVGCDFCLHWCHTDCGLRDLHIRNGRSVTGNTTEMQFHCVACNHPSEMFGFVKEVFKTCAKDWNVEKLSKELEYVRRIFRGSVDSRGREMHGIANQMLVHLENKGSALDVYNVIMTFLTESEPDTVGPSASGAKNHHNENKVKASHGLESLHKLSPVQVSSSISGGMLQPPSVSGDMNKQVDLVDPHSFPEKKPVDELECLVRMKQAEAKMFQTHADNARGEAEGLKRIADEQREKVDEEYRRQITRLRLPETEERCRQKFEQLKALERDHKEYCSMKLRMETDIKDMLLKMEATKQNLST